MRQLVKQHCLEYDSWGHMQPIIAIWYLCHEEEIEMEEEILNLKFYHEKYLLTVGKGNKNTK